MTRIPNDDLEVGWIYRIQARNFRIGIFTGEGFVGAREKFGETFLFEEYLMEMPGEDHRMFGTAQGLEKLGLDPLPEEWVGILSKKGAKQPEDRTIRLVVLNLLLVAETYLSEVKLRDEALHSEGLMFDPGEHWYDAKIVPADGSNAIMKAGMG